MNWRLKNGDTARNLHEQAEGFAGAAISLMEQILHSNVGKRADSWIFPIFMCINHSIEIYLKSVLYEVKQQEIVQDLTVKTNHNIKRILEDVEQELNKINCKHKIDGFPEMYSNLSEYILELCQNVPSEKLSEFMRYPIDIRNNQYFYANSDENVIVDIENLLSRFKQIADDLDRMYLWIESMDERN
jgi:hypothetical protein